MKVFDENGNHIGNLVRIPTDDANHIIILIPIDRDIKV